MRISEFITNKTIHKAIGTSSINHFQDQFLTYVYLLVHNEEIVYIGCSSGRNRVGQHQKDKIFDTIYYMLFDDCNAWDYEKELIKSIKTKYNKS